MKVLIISLNYEPLNSIGANRVNAFAKQLEQNNIDYRVISAFAGYHASKDFKPNTRVTYISQFDFQRFKRINFNKYKEQSSFNYKNTTKSKKGILDRFIFQLKVFYLSMLYPDPYIGWAVNCMIQKKKLLEDFKPDIIYSSSHPYSAHLVGYFFQKGSRAKWYAELRDPWVKSHSTGKRKSSFTKLLDKYFSRLLFRRATSLVTVSEVWKHEMENFYKMPTILTRNGFVMNNSNRISIGNSYQAFFERSKRKKIIYTGSIFPENQNLEGFLNSFLKNDYLQKNFDFIYVGPGGFIINKFLEKLSYKGDNVFILDKVSFEIALKFLEKADFLLLFNWRPENPGDKGVIPGKFYEYLGANKPILLWNDNINNELSDICFYINNMHEKDKILVVNDHDKINSDINHFEFDPEISKIYEFSREFQFKNLIASFNS
ncbi:MAG: hypothetical protein ABI594_08050 [Ginsengibacter sp.]